MISLSVVQNQVFDRLKSMVENPNFFSGWAERFAVPIYAQAQMDRWITEGGSQGDTWADLSSPYSQRKLRMFGGGVRLSGANKGESYPSYFGSGTKKLIASSRMLASVLPPAFRSGPDATHGEEYRQLTTDKSISFSTTVPYAVFADEQRSFSTWSSEFKQDLARNFARYLTSGGQS